jgi:hypothetical protein
VSGNIVAPASLRAELLAFVDSLGGIRGGYRRGALALGVSYYDLIAAMAQAGVRREVVERMRAGLAAWRAGGGS